MHSNNDIRNQNGTIRRPNGFNPPRVSGKSSPHAPITTPAIQRQQPQAQPTQRADVVAQKEVLEAKMAKQSLSIPEVIRTNPASYTDSSITNLVECITADIAMKYLETNTDNRELRDRVIRRYMADMLNGHWRLTHQGIAFDHMGVLIDGQHRLWAIVLAAEANPGIAIHMMVGRGYDPDTYRAIDHGTARCEADLMDEDRRTVAVAKSMVLGHRMSGGNFSRVNSGKLATENLQDFITAYRDGIQWAIKRLDKKQFMNATITAVFARAAIARNKDREKIELFISLVRDSEPGALGTNHPANLVRKLLDSKPKAHELYRKLESALVAFLNNAKLSQLRGVEKENFVLTNWARDTLV